MEAFQEHAVGVSTLLEEEGVEPRPAYSMELAFEELITNVIKYAYEDPDGHVIRYALRVDPDEVALEVEDDGDPFDPTTAELPEIPGGLEEAKVGGLGLHILRRTSKSFRYERRNGRNHISISFARS